MYSESNLINPVPDNNIDEKTWANIKEKLKNKEKISFTAKVQNTDRTVGTKLFIIYLKILEKIFKTIF